MTLIEYPDLEQGSDEWLAARCGIVTASVVGNLITKEQPPATEFACADCESGPGEPCASLTNGKPIKTIHTARTALAASKPPRLVTADNDTSRGLTLTLAAERLTGNVEDSYTSLDMQRGHDEEPFARDEYAAHFAPVDEIGFMVREWDEYRIGYSPDGLVGDDGLIEIKSRRQKTQVATVLAGDIPAANYAQLQCGLLVSGRKWIDYVSFSNGMHLWVQRVLPDPKWFDAITSAVDTFEENAANITQRYEAAIANLPATERIPELEEMRIA